MITNEIFNLVMFYYLLGSVLVIIIGLLKLHGLKIELKEDYLWLEYYESKLIFNYGVLAGMKRINL